VARVLIVGCGCRGRELAGALVADGHAVRGTTRTGASLEQIEATGAQAVIADPDRLSTLLPQIQGVTAVCWLMGTATAEPEVVAAIHGPRLQTMLDRIVDTPVRGVVYEGAGSVQPRWLEQGSAIVRAAAETYRMPVEVIEEDPSDHAAWLDAMTGAVRRILA
jgi:nucleoside-diphosphate-sugar epimerase